MAQYSILIIEDSLDARRLLMAYLSTLDYDLKINLVPSAEEAFLIAGQEKIDLLVSDYMLPGMTGADLVRWMRKRFPTVRVMMVTALDKADVALEVAELQIDSFLKKPLDMGEFTAAVEKSLRLAGAPEPPPKKPTSPFGSASSRISATVKTGELHTEPPNVQPQHTRLLDNPAQEPAATSQFYPSPDIQPKPAVVPQSNSPYIPPNQPIIPQSNPPPYISPNPTTGPLPYISPSPQASPMPPVAQSIPPVEREAETIKETPIAEPTPKASAASLTKFLDQILYSLPAETVFVLDGSGRIQSQVGEIPGGLAFEIWLPVIAKAINESTKLHTLSPGLRETGLLYRADLYEMIAAILNGYALVVVIKATQSNSRLWMALSQAMEAHSSLSLMLEKAPLKANPTQPIAPVMQMPPIPPSTPRQPNKTALLSENSVTEIEFKKTLERAAREMTREQAEKFWRERRKTGQLPGGRTPAEKSEDPDGGN